MPKFMIVEDSAAMRSVIASVLSQIPNAEVSEIDSGFDALKRLVKGPVDLFVLDINMPDINGLELLSFIRRNPRYVDTPVVIVTTETAEEDKQRGLALGASAYLTKPFDPNDLINTVRSLLGTSS